MGASEIVLQVGSEGGVLRKRYEQSKLFRDVRPCRLVLSRRLGLCSNVPCTWELMQNFRPGLYRATLVLAAFICFDSLSAFPQPVSHRVAVRGNCSGLHCATVRIDHVTALGKDLRYITASGTDRTYILSCLAYQCQLPVRGHDYEYSEMPVSDPSDSRYVFLTGVQVKHEQYALEAIVPELPIAEVRRLIGQCQSTDQLATEADCGKWLARKVMTQHSGCPNTEASIACNSFLGLVEANDRDLMDDLAHQDHVYACFLPGKDEFFEVTFSEPTWFGFGPPSDTQVKDGVPSDALTAVGGSEFAYYKNGVGDEDMTVHNLGNWIFFPLGNKADPQWMRKNATSKQAHFKGKNIEIDGDRWILTETYKNRAGAETTHTVTVQLATGRFQQNFLLSGTGQELHESSGRCLIVPSDYF